MEGERFDHLSRRVGQGLPRRSMIALLAGMLGGPLGIHLAPVPAQAACRNLNAKCRKKRNKKDKPPKCCSGLVCRRNRCRVKACSVFLGCAAGKGCCSGTCVDLQTDERNCGACGKGCAAGAKCIAGACRFCSADGEACQADHECCDPRPWGCLDRVCRNLCGAELSWCGEAAGCVNLKFNAAHCGACGRACGPGQACFNSRCCESGECCADYGEACATADACCDTPCTSGICCRPLGHRCSFTEECCSGFCTGEGGFCCQPGGKPYGASCASDSECCVLTDGSHIPCSGGLCRFP